MRLIDADALAMHLADWQLSSDEDERDVIEEAIRAIDTAPTIDAVPVVRCKNCKWFDKQRCVCHNPRYGDGYANYQPPNTNDEYWCADGERKDDEIDRR